MSGARLALSIGVFVAVPLLALNLRPAVTSVGAMLTDIRSGTGMSAVLASVVVAAPVWCFAVGGALAFAMRTRFGTSRTVSLALAALAMTLASRVLGGPYLLLGGTVLACLAIAVLGTLLPVITHAAPARAWALLTGCYVAAMGGGSGIGALITPQVAERSSWQLGVSGWALLAAAAWAAWRVASRKFSEPSVRTTKHPGPSSLAPATTAWSLTLHFGLASGFTFSIMGWLPSMLLDYSHVDPGRVQWMFTVAMALGVPIALVVPKWARATSCQSGLAVALAAPSLVATVGLLILPAWNPWLWSIGLGLGMPAVGLALALISLRAAPDGDTAAALSSMVQGIGYAIAGATALFCGLLRSSTGTWDWPLLALLVILCGQIVSGMHAGVPVIVRTDGMPDRRSIPAPRKPTPLPSAARRALPPAAAPIKPPLMHAPVLPPRPVRAPTAPPMHVHPPMQRPGHRAPVPVAGWGHRTSGPMPTPPPIRPPMRHPNGPWHGPAVPPLYGPPRPARPTAPPPIAAIADNAKTGALIPSPRNPAPHPYDQSSTEVVVPRRRTPALSESTSTEKVMPRNGGPLRRPAVADVSPTETVTPRSGGSLPRSALADASSTEKVMPRNGGPSPRSALADSSSTETVTPRSGGSSRRPDVPAVADVSSTEKVAPPAGRPPLPAPHFPVPESTEVVIPKPRTSALAESSDIETLKPGAGTPPLPEPHFPPPAQSPATDLAALQPRTREPDAETEDLCIAEAVTDDLCVAEAETEGLGVAEATEDLCVAEAETEDLCVAEAETEDLRVAEAAADDLSVAEALIPEPRTGDEPAPVQPDLGLSAPAEEPSAIYVAAPDRQTAPELQAAPELQTVPDRQAAPVAEPENSAEVAIPQPRAEAEAEVEDDPEQLELALVLESEAVHFDPRMFPDRTIHIPYPRQASS